MVGKFQGFSCHKKKFRVNVSLWAKLGVFSGFFSLIFKI